MGKYLVISNADFSEVAVETVTPQIDKLPIITITPSGNVTITCAGATNIYYTTDGSTPTTNSTVYTSSFIIPFNTKVKAIASFEDGSVSKVVEKLYLHNLLGNEIILRESVTTGMTSSTTTYRFLESNTNHNRATQAVENIWNTISVLECNPGWVYTIWPSPDRIIEAKSADGYAYNKTDVILNNESVEKTIDISGYPYLVVWTKKSDDSTFTVEEAEEAIIISGS